MNAVLVKADAVGPTLYYGAGAGAEPTASAVVADIIDVVRTLTADPENRVPHLAFQPGALSDLPILDIEDVDTAHCLIAVSGSFKPCPVKVHTATLPEGILPSFQSWISPAKEAAEAGSQNTPSCSANNFCVCSICASLHSANQPSDSLLACQA